MYIGLRQINQHKKSTVIGWSTITVLIDSIVAVITNGPCEIFFRSDVFFCVALENVGHFWLQPQRHRVTEPDKGKRLFSLSLFSLRLCASVVKMIGKRQVVNQSFLAGEELLDGMHRGLTADLGDGFDEW
jgi:hypothetical protein